jgi:hypothetical protein
MKQIAGSTEMGPGASILLRNPLTKQQVDELDVWLQSIVRKREGDASKGYTFWLNENAFPGTVSQCLFDLGMNDPFEWAEENERKKIVECLGYFPQQEIGVFSGCNQKSDHFTLGCMMLQLAELYGSLINMGGAITPPLQPTSISKDFFTKQRSTVAERKAYLRTQFDAIAATLPLGKTLRDLLKERYSNCDSPLDKISADMEEKFGPVLPPCPEPSLGEISAFVQGMPGKVYEIYYETARKTQWVYHIVDTTFMRAWLSHPHFYMVK